MSPVYYGAKIFERAVLESGVISEMGVGDEG